uniref:Uncharacterized protein n=1 Tax=Strongyloides papillosus TaxID=174720 RepID=A0A0N5BI39_STREA
MDRIYKNKFNEEHFFVNVFGTPRWDDPCIKDVKATLRDKKGVLDGPKNLTKNREFHLYKYKSSNILIDELFVKIKYKCNDEDKALKKKIPQSCIQNKEGKEMSIKTSDKVTVYFDTELFNCNLGDIRLKPVDKQNISKTKMQ